MTKNLPANAPGAVFLLVSRLAQRFGLTDVDPQELVTTLKATAFNGNGNPPTDAQMTALLLVAEQHGLNPWLKEIHAFAGKGGGIVPIVGVDGWSNIINNHPQMDGMEFEYDWTEGDEHITCVIWRKDRSKPIKVTEWLSECVRPTEPWKMRRRMLRHKAMMQCGRVAFSYGNIHDPDEANDIIQNENFMGPAEVVPPTGAPAQATASSLPAMTAEDLHKREAKIAEFYSKGKTVEDIVGFYSTKFTVGDDMRAGIARLAPVAPNPAPSDVQDVRPKVTYAQVAERINKSESVDQLDEAALLIGEVADEHQRVELTGLYETRLQELKE